MDLKFSRLIFKQFHGAITRSQKKRLRTFVRQCLGNNFDEIMTFYLERKDREKASYLPRYIPKKPSFVNVFTAQSTLHKHNDPQTAIHSISHICLDSLYCLSNGTLTQQEGQRVHIFSYFFFFFI